MREIVPAILATKVRTRGQICRGAVHRYPRESVVQSVHEIGEVLKPDLITMDIIMKKVNGIKATARIKSESPSIKVVMITQAAKPSLVQESMRCGASNFIIKPFVENTLMNALKKVFAS